MEGQERIQQTEGYGQLQEWIIPGATVMAVGTRGGKVNELTFSTEVGPITMTVPISAGLWIDDISTDAEYRLTFRAGGYLEFEQLGD